jgi:hypothetical protein
VAPLCTALGDPSDVVRQAVAVALKRLARIDSSDCLRARFAVETNAAVRDQIRRTIEAIEAARTENVRAAAAQGAGATYYVSLSKVANHSQRDSAAIERIVHDAIVSKLADVGGYDIAPAGETAEAARVKIAAKNLKGYYLSTRVEKFDYTGEGLRVGVKIAIFSYPGRDLRGEVPAAGAIPGARPGDKAAEDQLLGVVAARAAELFTQSFR